MPPVDLEVIAHQKDGQEILGSGTALWHVVRSVAEQVVCSLDELGYVRVDEAGQVHGFKVKDLAVSPDGRLAVVHLDTSAKVFEPTAQKPAHRGKVVPYLSLVSEKVIEQLRVRVSDMIGSPVDVWADNHYFVRYVVDLHSVGRHKGAFPAGDLVDHLDAVPGPFTIPLGLDQSGELIWLDLVKSPRHMILTGTTGGGKTTLIDTSVCTLIRHTSPDRLNMVFLDPQRGLNFKPYQALTDYHFTDEGGTLGVVTDAESIISAVTRLNREYLRRTELIAASLWSNVEEYNAHVDAKDQLPYIFLFTDELDNLAIELEKLGAKQVKAFMSNLRALISGSRKVGFRVVLCLQYLHRDTIPPAIASQAALTLAFWSSKRGSRSTLGDEAANKLPGAGRFIVEGLPGVERKILQGLYINRETVLELVDAKKGRPARSVDNVVMDVITYALREMDGRLPRNKLSQAFGHLSGRQVDNLLSALEYVGLALPADRSTVPPQPRRLKATSAEEAKEILQYHPEICFREDSGRLRFGPSAA